MRCSSSESLLDEYVEGTLRGPIATAVGRHVEACARCRALLDELRVIDRVLANHPRIEPAADFTRSTMAEIRAMPAPAVPRARTLEIVGAYLLFAWVTIVLWLAPEGPISRTALSLAQSVIAGAGGTLARIAQVVWHAVGGEGPVVVAFVVGVLAFDLAVAATIVVLFTVVRPRLAERLTSAAGSGGRWETA